MPSCLRHKKSPIKVTGQTRQGGREEGKEGGRKGVGREEGR